MFIELAVTLLLRLAVLQCLKGAHRKEMPKAAHSKLSLRSESLRQRTLYLSFMDHDMPSPSSRPTSSSLRALILFFFRSASLHSLALYRMR